jgi:hypothetical protein
MKDNESIFLEKMGRRRRSHLWQSYFSSIFLAILVVIIAKIIGGQHIHGMIYFFLFGVVPLGVMAGFIVGWEYATRTMPMVEYEMTHDIFFDDFEAFENYIKKQKELENAEK